MMRLQLQPQLLEPCQPAAEEGGNSLSSCSDGSMWRFDDTSPTAPLTGGGAGAASRPAQHRCVRCLFKEDADAAAAMPRLQLPSLPRLQLRSPDAPAAAQPGSPASPELAAWLAEMEGGSSCRIMRSALVDAPPVFGGCPAQPLGSPAAGAAAAAAAQGALPPPAFVLMGLLG